MKRYRSVAELSGLPSFALGSRGTVWWGVIMFMIIEGMTVAVCIASYLYVRGNFSQWPPPPTELPSVVIPTIGVVVMVASIFVMARLEKAARAFDLGAVRTLSIVICVFAIALCVLRYFDFRALHTFWDSNAYGSTSWATVAFHSSLLALETIETMVITALVLWGPFEKKHFSDVEDNALYWYFMCAIWIPAYVVVFLSPRFL